MVQLGYLHHPIETAGQEWLSGCSCLRVEVPPATAVPGSFIWGLLLHSVDSWPRVSRGESCRECSSTEKDAVIFVCQLLSCAACDRRIYHKACSVCSPKAPSLVQAVTVQASLLGPVDEGSHGIACCKSFNSILTLARGTQPRCKVPQATVPPPTGPRITATRPRFQEHALLLKTRKKKSVSENQTKLRSLSKQHHSQLRPLSNTLLSPPLQLQKLGSPPPKLLTALLQQKSPFQNATTREVFLGDKTDPFAQQTV